LRLRRGTTQEVVDDVGGVCHSHDCCRDDDSGVDDDSG
jgi:hypothetical protein